MFTSRHRRGWWVVTFNVDLDLSKVNTVTFGTDDEHLYVKFNENRTCGTNLRTNGLAENRKSGTNEQINKPSNTLVPSGRKYPVGGNNR